MKEISDIYKIPYRGGADFRGTLRNERQFKYDQRVFIGSGSGENIKLYPAIVKGIRDDKDHMNPSYIYDVQVPNWVVEEIREDLCSCYDQRLSDIPFYKFRLRRNVKQYHNNQIESIKEYRSLKCDRIFTSIKDAKESVLENHKQIEELNREAIDRYFKRFDKLNDR